MKNITITVSKQISKLILENNRTNSLDIDFLKELNYNIETIEENEQSSVIIIESRSPFGFSSGLDLRSMYVPNNDPKTNVFFGADLLRVGRLLIQRSGN